MTFVPARMLLINLLVLLIACSRENVKSLNDNNPSLQELLRLIPANTATQTYLINKALLAKGSSGVLDLCLNLNEKDEQIRTAAEYALCSLAFQVTRSNTAEERQEFLQGIYLALQADQLRGNRSLLISLLKVAGDESSLKPLAQYLPDETLSALVVPAMLNIGAPSAAGKELLSALPRITGNNRMAIIQALGQLGYLPAAGRIFKFISDPDTVISLAAISALADMGYEPLRPVLLESIAESKVPFREQLILTYLQFIEQVKDKSRAAQYCREIIANSPAYFSGHHRLVAAGMLIDILGGIPAWPDVLNFMRNCPVKDQLTMLTFLKKMDTAALIGAISPERNKFSATWQAGFITMLGSRKDQKAIPFIETALQDTAVIVRAAAVNALLQIQPAQVSELLIPVMCRESDSLIIDALYTGLKTVPTQELFPALAEHYPEMNLAGRQLVLNIMGERQIRMYSDFVIGQMSAGQAEVRIAAIQNIAGLAVAGDLPVLISQLQRTSAAEQEILFKSILELISRYQDEPAIHQAIMEFAQNENDSNREFLLRMLKRSGADQALQILRAEIKSGKAEIKDAAWRTLCEWPRLNALNDLLDLVASKEDLTYRVLATRACLRLLQENDSGKEIEFQDYKTLFESTPRLEEKKMVLAAMADLKSEKALHYLASLINDPELGPEVTLTIMNMVKTASDSTTEIKDTEIAATFLQNQLKPGSAAEKIVLVPADSLHNQPPAGFIVLFNGHDLAGWQIIDGLPDSWQVQDSVLYTTGEGGGWLSTDRIFSDFKMELEFRSPAGGNSGVFIRAPHEGDAAYTGMEIQLLDDYAQQYANLKPWQYCGSIYGIQAPVQRVSKPDGVWQKMVIDCRGPQIKVTLNDVMIIDTNLIVHMDQEATHPGIKRRAGHIGLQNHSTRVEFRKIRIIEYE